MRDKHILAISDTHCGHRVGLTPPQWWTNNSDDKYQIARRAYWEWFAAEIKTLPTLDIVIVNGDMIDGKGQRSGGVEQLTVDMTVQADMACEVLRIVGGDKVAMVSGTPYHTGEAEDFERLIAAEIGATIGDHEWYEINRLVFDVKHHIGGSSVPYGKGTALAKDQTWNTLWAEHEEQPKADVIIRSHVHRYYQVSDIGPRGMWYGFTTPGLQGYGSRYGARRCSQKVHFGFVSMTATCTGGLQWQPHIARLPVQRAHALTL